MERRRFLKTMVLVAGGFSALGCGDGGSGATADGGEPALEGRDVREGSKYFPQSVASGDPKPESVVLWARVEDTSADGDLRLVVQVALDAEFTMPLALAKDGALTASAIHDGCVRARIDGLEPGTTYYYRFAYLKGAADAFVSRTGRTKTAPRADADTRVKFAVTSCQDYIGRYFHAYKHMAEQDLDFFLHLGDYVYETSGDPSFQVTTGKRAITFGDREHALELGADGNTYYAANSLDNYRELYKIYRSDPDLQRIHESFPMIAVSDDHEFSDDCHGQTATYFDGRKDEREPARRSHADRAWFEFMPVDYPEPDFEYDAAAQDFPDDLTIYRDFTFGRHVRVVMTDLRRYRDDHLIPEGAFPGAVAATQDELVAALGEIPEFATEYVDLDDAPYEELKAWLNAQAEGLGFVKGDFAGLVGVAFINEQLAAVDDPKKPAGPLEQAQERGIVFAQMFKTARFSNVGSRYAVIAAPYDAFARVLWVKSKGKVQQILGDEQEAWFIDTIRSAKQTWKIWGNEYTLMPRTIDLRAVPTAGLLGLQTVLHASVEDWDGMPDRRAKLLGEIGDVPNVVAVTGDIHAFFAGNARSDEDPSKGILEFVAGAISSATYKDLLVSITTSIHPAAGALAQSAPELLKAANPHLAHLDLERNGYGVFDAGPDTLDVTYYALPGASVLEEKLDGSVSKAFEASHFYVQRNKKQIRRDRKGKAERWDPEAGAWVEI